MTTKIQTILICGHKHRTEYWMQKESEKAKKINKKTWRLWYDKSWTDTTIEILPPVTYE